ncbi:UbiA prenyltransferase family-domain-containing protein [Hypoxylon trugodes]|uniref:UbiA prenyltransferase family-domain-containing protein n=1 Tax=Hypoxylon trugodes TaxID=326681 RepID=UPI00218F2C9D|nr:UbiA prenyltransferase family-domain-containing protein [Hypoxylon trugodes]KAI1394480.1 UbiA prenyltransferase family-domain-containing protein [Hypoxylon trugodes]
MPTLISEQAVNIVGRKPPQRSAPVDKKSGATLDAQKTGADGVRYKNKSLTHSFPVGKISEKVYTLYLFTASDFVSVLVPQTLFAFFSCGCGHLFANGSAPLISSSLARIPSVITWIWLQLLVLATANQRLPDSIVEDKHNKPWRPIPAGRITVEGTQKLLLASMYTTLAFAFYMGSTLETLLLFALNWTYNDLKMSDNLLMRNFLNAAGITTIGAGAMRVAAGPHSEFDDRTVVHWCLLCASMIMTTIHAQDLYDQIGDAARGRATIPLVYGDSTARWTIAVAVLFWSILIPLWMGQHPVENWRSYVMPLMLGGVVALRVLLLKEVAADKTSFKTWVLWIIYLYGLPMMI